MNSEVFEGLYVLVRREGHRQKGKFWSHKERGYTDSIVHAGVYDAVRSAEIVGRSEKTERVPLTELLRDSFYGNDLPDGTVGALLRTL